MVKLTLGFRLTEQTYDVGDEEGGRRRATGVWTGGESGSSTRDPWCSGSARCRRRWGSRGIQRKSGTAIIRKRYVF